MKRIFLFFLINAYFSVHSFTQTVITNWTFETSIPATTGPHSAEVGTGNASGFHASSSVVYSNPSGNGSVESFSSNFWAVGDYYEFTSATTGYQNISITWDATGSSTGPRDFKVQYSTNGSTFIDVTGTNGTYSLTGESWSAGTNNSNSTRTLDLSSVTSLNNASAIYFRLICNSTTSINGGTIATGGTSRVDNFKILASSTLPIVLNYFNIKNNYKQSHITFSTSSETNNSHFLIEWSRDAKNWNEIGTVKGSGTTREVKEYSFIHETFASGTNYYRLTQVDLDGRKETFHVKSVYFGSKEKGFNITPSLAQNDLRFEFDQPVSNGRMLIYNLDGQLMSSYILSEGIEVLRIDISGLPTGQYIAKYIDGEEIINKKFIKQ